jgi:signal transduction histidine kinase
MLAHSRTSSGKKEPTDLNVLADEYLRLAFHGMKAKEKSFHANYTLHANPLLPKVNIIPQEIGRVLLNLISNAFYAVHAKAKAKTAQVKDGSPPAAPITSNYAPMVTVSSKSHKDKVELIIEDNGMGIPKEIRQKIFQPFFTTKPTGEGTGLGLSLSYDIVKAHGGSLLVESKEGAGSTFTISLLLS